jgi:IrrE N-terminal-like domain
MGLGIGTGVMAAKRWPYFSKLAEQFNDVLVGIEDDLRQFNGEPMRFPAHVRSLVGPLSLRETASMMAAAGAVPAIGINSLHHPNRRRFTLAHELAHVVLHPAELKKAVHVDKGSLRRNRVSAAGTDMLEIEANAFAAELLMPEELLSAVLDEKLDLEDPQVLEALANKFRVSMTALQHRLHI